MSKVLRKWKLYRPDEERLLLDLLARQCSSQDTQELQQEPDTLVHRDTTVV